MTRCPGTRTRVADLVPGGNRDLTVAVTGPTGTFGFALMPSSKPTTGWRGSWASPGGRFDPAGYGWTKMDYHRGDVRDPQDLQDAFGHADVVVHLAFLVTGAASSEAIRSINVEGTLNAFHAAAAAGARRSVYASSVAAYGFHSDNPIGKTEGWPVRAAARLFYAQEKAQLEHLLRAESARSAGPVLYLLRPSIVLGPHAVGAKGLLPGPLAPLARALASRAGQMPLPIPVLAPALPVQFVHEEGHWAGAPAVRRRRAAWCIQHRRRRDRHRHRHCPRTRHAPAAPSGGPCAVRGPGHRGPAFPAARRGMGGGGQPSGDHDANSRTHILSAAARCDHWPSLAGYQRLLEPAMPTGCV